MSVNFLLSCALGKQASSGAEEREHRRNTADALLNMQSTSGALADYLTPHAWGGERAGRAETLGRAAGLSRDQIPFSVKHPSTNDILSMAAGQALGGAAGGVLEAWRQSRGGKGNAAVLPAVGVGLGAIGGLLYGASRRRERMQEIKDRYVQRGGKPKVPEFSTLATYLAPLRGPHRKGQINAYKALEKDTLEPRRHPLATDLAYTLAMINPEPITRMAYPWALNYAYNIRADLEARNQLRNLLRDAQR